MTNNSGESQVDSLGFSENERFLCLSTQLEQVSLMLILFIFIDKKFLSQKPLSMLTCLENPNLCTAQFAKSCNDDL